MKLHIINEPIKNVATQCSCCCNNLCVYKFTFFNLPLYAVVEKFDFSLLDAARDLGATNFQALEKSFIPNKSWNNNFNYFLH